MFRHTLRNMSRLRIGYIPEHFSTPLHFAQKHFSLDAELIPYPTGTGALTAALRESDRAKGIDVAIGLTEGFVADLGKAKAAGTPSNYALAGTYVESPLCWAISTGAKREELRGVADLKGKTVGVSRIGSGSYVMSFVLADQQGWLNGDAAGGYATHTPIGDFAALRKSVNAGDTDFFMWEHFTTKHFWDNGELKRIGEIYTPWPSWMIAARTSAEQQQLADLGTKLDQGVKYYHAHQDEAVEYITTAMHYSKDDALEWMKTVKFADRVSGVRTSVIDSTVQILRKAGVLTEEAGGSAHMISHTQ